MVLGPTSVGEQHFDDHQEERAAIDAIEATVSTLPGSGNYVHINEQPRSPLQAAYGGAFTTTAIQVALTGGAAVHLPAGLAVMDGSILMPDGATLLGVPGKTILQAPPGAAIDLVKDALGGSFTLDGVTLDGNKANVTSGGGYGVHLGTVGLPVSGVVIRRCTIRNTRLSGIRWFNCDDIDVIDNRFEDCGDVGQLATTVANAITAQGHRARISRNHISGTAGHGVGQSALTAGLTSGLIVHDNRIVDSGEFGIALGNLAVDCVVTGNWVEGAGINCIDTGSALRLKVTDNVCIDGIDDGIDIDASAITLTDPEVGILIANNQVRNCGRYGIIVLLPSAASGVTVANNQVDTCGQVGIALSHTLRAVVAGNTVRNHSVEAGYSGIAMSEDCERTQVHGNIIFEDRAVPHGVGYNDVDGDYQTLIGNDFAGCATPFGTVAKANDIRASNRP